MRKGLVIGVQRYREGWSEAIAPAVAADTEEISTLLRSLGFALPSMPLGAGGSEVSSDDVRDAIIDLLEGAEDEDEVVVYFSGHGRQQGGTLYLVHSRARRTHSISALVDLRFDDAVAQTRARSVTFLVDACRTGDDAAFTPPATNARGHVTSFVFASKPGHPAHTRDGASVFTRSLVKVVRDLPTETTLRVAVDEIQRVMSHTCERAGIPEQRIDVVTNLADDATAPFPLFGTGPATGVSDRWTALVRESAKLTDALPAGQLQRLLPELDRVEREAPRLVAPGPVITPLAQPGLADRLMRALEKVLPRLPEGPDRPLLLGLAAVVEAGLRRAEASLLTACEPLQADMDEWEAHRLAPLQLFAGQKPAFVADLAGVVGRVLPEAPLDRRRLVQDALCNCAQAVFDDPAARHELDERLEVDVEQETEVAPRRLSAALELAWWLSLDTRLFPEEFRVAAQHDAEDVPDLIARLDGVRWWERESALDLDARITYAPLDYALRTMTEAVSAQLFRDAQVGAPLHGLGLPVVATAGRVVPVDHAYTLPHFTFQMSTSELSRLLMGTEFYGDESLALREVYQNAVDACRYREQRELSYSEESRYEPHVRIEERDVGGRRVVDFVDNGVGMSDHELREAFARVGKRFRDLPEFIEEQSRWHERGRTGFYPISQFGIGVLSYFMVADRVELWTMRKTGPTAYSTARHVDILAGADLFRVRSVDSPQVPSGGGTRVRLHLRPDVQDRLDVASTMRQIVRAPLIRVSHHVAGSAETTRWSPGLLYTRDGEVVQPCHHVPDFGVYFHEGTGEVLVNGIPADVGVMPAFGHGYRGPTGFTISVDARLSPELSVDRRTLRRIDEARAREFLQQAARAVAEWPDASVNWLAELFSFDAGAGRAAFRALRDSNRRLPLRMPLEPSADTEVSLLLSESGFYLRDPYLSGGGSRILDDLRWAELSSVLGEEEPAISTPDHPAFDDRLAVFQAVVEDSVADLGSLARAAEYLGISLGATAAFAWALEFLDRQLPPMWLRQAASELTRARNPGTWAVLEGLAAVAVGAANDDVVHWVLSTAESTAARVVHDVLHYEVAPDAFPPPPAVRVLLSRDADGLRPYVVTDGQVDWSHVREVTGRMSESGEIPAEDLEQAMAWLTAHLGPDPALASGGPDDAWPPALPSGYDFPTGASAAARLSASVDFDGRSPFYEVAVPAGCVSRAAVREEVDPEDLVRELKGLGLLVVPAERDWAVLRKLHPVLVGARGYDWFDVAGHLRITSMSQFGSLLSSSLLPPGELLRALAEADILTPRMRTMVGIPFDSSSVQALGRVLTQDFEFVEITWVQLAQLADLLERSYGTAFGMLSPLRGVVRGWHLPDALPPGLAETSVPRRLAGGMEHWLGDGLDPVENLLLSAWMALASESSLREIADRLIPLMRLSAVDTGLLDRAADSVTDPVIFDDALVLATQQFRPRVTDPELAVALCRPFARDETHLRRRVNAWLDLRADLRPADARWALRATQPSVRQPPTAPAPRPPRREAERR